ncbi:hypothetical protein GQ42DRAFT_177844 [Ramicandelaber brevisporus]|nr:hypothetical protein GQ42DRAFT_177844 [Ramicandelaber brevisporus]
MSTSSLPAMQILTRHAVRARIRLRYHPSTPPALLLSTSSAQIALPQFDLHDDQRYSVMARRVSTSNSSNSSNSSSRRDSSIDDRQRLSDRKERLSRHVMVSRAATAEDLSGDDAFQYTHHYPASNVHDDYRQLDERVAINNTALPDEQQDPLVDPLHRHQRPPTGTPVDELWHLMYNMQEYNVNDIWLSYVAIRKSPEVLQHLSQRDWVSLVILFGYGGYPDGSRRIVPKWRAIRKIIADYERLYENTPSAVITGGVLWDMKVLSLIDAGNIDVAVRLVLNRLDNMHAVGPGGYSISRTPGEEPPLHLYPKMFMCRQARSATVPSNVFTECQSTTPPRLGVISSLLMALLDLPNGIGTAMHILRSWIHAVYSHSVPSSDSGSSIGLRSSSLPIIPRMLGRNSDKDRLLLSVFRPIMYARLMLALSDAGQPKAARGILKDLLSMVAVNDTSLAIFNRRRPDEVEYEEMVDITLFDIALTNIFGNKSYRFTPVDFMPRQSFETHSKYAPHNFEVVFPADVDFAVSQLLHWMARLQLTLSPVTLRRLVKASRQYHLEYRSFHRLPVVSEQSMKQQLDENVRRWIKDRVRAPPAKSIEAQ